MKLCECGCGQATKPAAITSRARGYVAGEPQRFVYGHRARLRMPDPLEGKYEVMPSGCWEWRKIILGGYGYLHDRRVGRNVRAHRYVYELLVGPIPTGLTLDHLCRNTICVNPDHLEPVTMRENTLRGTAVSAINAAKTECIRGHPLSGDNLYLRGGKRHCRACRKQHRQQRTMAEANHQASPSKILY